MTALSKASIKEYESFTNAVTPQISSAKRYADAAQAFASAVFDHFRESVVLSRVFATVAYEQLAPPNKRAVDSLASAKQVSGLINPQTLILTLFGTRGIVATWNDRNNSRGHTGIPLVSSAFIESIPMMSRLLKQMGAGIDWIANNDTSIVTRAMGRMSGVFFVRDAATETDQLKRKVIAAQDFVKAHGIKSVFGFGGGYMNSNTFAVSVLFLKETVEKEKAEAFAARCGFFKLNTANLVRDQRFF